MPLRLYNSLTQTKDEFQPLRPGRVGMYVCGPTVYSASHIGHMVGPVIFDTLKKYLVYSGFQVHWVVNITDVDDKLIVQANKEGTTVKELAERVTTDYLACLEALGVDGIDSMPRATEYIDEILAMTASLVERGFAYPANGDVYFDVTRSPDYGKLSHRDPEELQAGTRIEPSVIKRHPGDFALWKSSKPGEPSWNSPWGPGRPGWHIECSAMSMKLLGEQFDIHGGGLDLIFPHHENEVAQSEAFSGKTFVNYWLHNGLLTKNGRKIAKSDPDTLLLMRDLLEIHQPDTIRALLLMGHYRRPTDYDNERLNELARGLQAFRTFFDRFERITSESFYTLPSPGRHDEPTATATGSEFLEEVARHRAACLEALDDDFNTGGAFGILFDLLRTLNRFADAAKLDAPDRAASAFAEFHRGVVVLRDLTRIFGLFRQPLESRREDQDQFTGQLMELLIHLRAELRKQKNFTLADEIRKRLTELQVTLEDRPEGTLWKRG